MLSLFLVSGFAASAAQLSSDLDENEIKEALKILAWGSNHKTFSAHGVVNANLGLDLGLEASFLVRQGLNELGDGTGVAPNIVPVPKLWMSWDLPSGINVSSSFSPGFWYGGVSAFGLAGQWNFWRQNQVTATAILSYTFASSFNGDIVSHTPSLRVNISKDLGVWQPFAGLGLVSANGSLKEELTSAGTDAGPYTAAATHLVAGFRLDLLAQLVFQVDLIGTRPSFGVLYSHRF